MENASPVTFFMPIKTSPIEKKPAPALEKPLELVVSTPDKLAKELAKIELTTRTGITSRLSYELCH